MSELISLGDLKNGNYRVLGTNVGLTTVMLLLFLAVVSTSVLIARGIPRRRGDPFPVWRMTLITSVLLATAGMAIVTVPVLLRLP